MIAIRRSRGASAVMILLVLVLLLVGFFAVYTLSRVGASGDAREDTKKRLAAAATALERFVAENARLPCPANPAASTGAADPAVASATCTYPEGTLPWLAVGLNSDAGIDAWGRKISYRVYTGNAGNGSLTQAGGASMVDCDLVEPTIGATTATGLCVSSTDPYARTSSAAKFLAGKGLSLNDFGVAHNDVAYVLISHGETGLGGYSVAGSQLPMPAGDERNNIRATGPFTIRAFSDPDTGSTSAQHFDDLLVYATIPDLVKRAGLEARDWPDTASSSVVFDASTIAAVTGQSVTTGDLGTATLDFGSARVTGFSAGGTSTDITYGTNTASPGNPATGGIGIAGNFSDFMSNIGSEYVHIEFTSAAAKFAITLNDFGTYALFGTNYTERVELRFYLNNTLVGSAITKSACNADGGLASFSVTPAGVFNSVDIVPVTSTGSPSGSSYSAFLVSEIAACPASAATCRTGLWSGANNCP